MRDDPGSQAALQAQFLDAEVPGEGLEHLFEAERATGQVDDRGSEGIGNHRRVGVAQGGQSTQERGVEKIDFSTRVLDFRDQRGLEVFQRVHVGDLGPVPLPPQRCKVPGGFRLDSTQPRPRSTRPG